MRGHVDHHARRSGRLEQLHRQKAERVLGLLKNPLFGQAQKRQVWGRSSVESRPDRRWSRGVRPPPPWGRCTRLVRPWAAVGASCGPTALGWSVGGCTPCLLGFCVPNRRYRHRLRQLSAPCPPRPLAAKPRNIAHLFTTDYHKPILRATSCPRADQENYYAPPARDLPPPHAPASRSTTTTRPPIPNLLRSVPAPPLPALLCVSTHRCKISNPPPSTPLATPRSKLRRFAPLRGI